MALTAADWPITAALLQFPGVLRDGTRVQDADASVWAGVFREVADAGFAAVDLFDAWLQTGDLSPQRLDELTAAGREAGVDLPVISIARRSVLDAQHGDDNLAYSHRTLDAAAAIGATTVSVGLHQALTAAQQRALWFWTEPGHVDPPDDPDEWDRAVTRIRELGRHAEEVGVLLSLEMYEDTYIGTGASAARLVEEVGLAGVGLNPDVGNLIRLHRPIEDWRACFEQVLPWANYMHTKNYVRDEDPGRGLYFSVPSPLASGLIDYRWVVQVALEHGFQGILCLENYGGDGLSVCAANQEYLRRHVLPKRDGYALGTSRVRQANGVETS